MAPGPEPPVLDEDSQAVQGGREVAHLGARQLDERGRFRGPAPPLEERERRKEPRLGSPRGVELDPQRDRVARGGGGQVWREVQTEGGHGDFR